MQVVFYQVGLTSQSALIKGYIVTFHILFQAGPDGWVDGACLVISQPRIWDELNIYLYTVVESIGTRLSAG